MEKLKKFLNMFNIFELNLSARSYKSGIIRIIVSLLIIFAVCLFRFSITITNAAVNIVVSLLLLAIMIMCILCFFIASVECLQVGDNRKKDKERAALDSRYINNNNNK
ncbi:MAG: hypothetical protein J6V80_00250 [Clostridia bacterium]|nr:hypothetical protein [Clostridia bacterium]